MATRTLIDGATDLTSTASWSGGAVPVTGDDVEIPRGGQHIDTFSLAAVRLNSLDVAFGGTIETAAGAALAVDVDNATSSEARITGTGARLKFAGGSTNAKWENTLVNSPGSYITFTGGEYEDATIEAGNVVLDSTATCDTMHVLGGQVTLAGIASASWSCNVYGGTVKAYRPGTYNVYAGTVELDVTVAGTTTVNLFGGTLVHVNGDFGGAIHATYIDRLEEPATISGVTISSRASIRTTSRATWASVTQLGIVDAGGPLLA